MKHKISFRPITDNDLSFLYQLYASTREDELCQTGWSEFEKENFLRQQFSAQHSFYTEQFSKADFHLILYESKPIGRLYTDNRKKEIRLIDISLVPEYRGKGIGSQLLKDIFVKSRKIKKPVRIHVEKYNPALRLYERLGFDQIGDTGVYYLMEWVPK